MAGSHATTTGPNSQSNVAYPPSCLAWTVVRDEPSGPSYSRSTSLAVLDQETLQPLGYEPVVFTFWRVACSGGRSALLLRISRDSNADLTKVVQFPLIPGLAAKQGSQSGLVRLTQEPSTFESHLAPGALIAREVTVVVENFFRHYRFDWGASIPGVSEADSDRFWIFDNALEITIPNPSTGGVSPPLVVSIPAYDKSQYPAASQPLPITGYNAGSYFDPAHSGEGIIVDVTSDLPGPFGLIQRGITLAWFTYDQTGRPFWIYGTKIFTPGVRSADVLMSYFANGSFAGGSSAQATRSPWGTVTVAFPDCASMFFSYAASANPPAPVPSGSGERRWARLSQENGLRCQ